MPVLAAKVTFSNVCTPSLPISIVKLVEVAVKVTVEAAFLVKVPPWELFQSPPIVRAFPAMLKTEVEEPNFRSPPGVEEAQPYVRVTFPAGVKVLPFHI